MRKGFTAQTWMDAVLCLFLLILTGGVTSENMTISLQTPLPVTEGDDVTLTCEAGKGREVNYTWGQMINGRLVTFTPTSGGQGTERGRRKVYLTGQSVDSASRLTIHDVRVPMDAGQYVCIGHQLVNGRHSRTVSFFQMPCVIELPKPPSMDSLAPQPTDTESLRVQEGQMLVIKCSIKVPHDIDDRRIQWILYHPDRVDWLADDSRLNVTVDKSTSPSCMTTVTATFKQRLTRKDQQMSLACFNVPIDTQQPNTRNHCTRSAIQLCSVSSPVRVHYGVSSQHMRLEFWPLHTKGSRQMALFCLAEGYPEVTYSWSRLVQRPDSDGQNDLAEAVQGEPLGSGGRLNLSSDSLANLTAVYICTAQNTDQRKSHAAVRSIALICTADGDCEEVVQRQRRQLAEGVTVNTTHVFIMGREPFQEGGSVQLMCEARGYPLPDYMWGKLQPNNSILWANVSRDPGTPLEGFYDSLTQASFLTLTDIDKDTTEGEYFCLASNDANNVTYTAIKSVYLKITSSVEYPLAVAKLWSRAAPPTEGDEGLGLLNYMLVTAVVGAILIVGTIITHKVMGAVVVRPDTHCAAARARLRTNQRRHAPDSQGGWPAY